MTKTSDRDAAKAAIGASSPLAARLARTFAGDGAGADQQRGDRDQALRGQRDAEHRDDDRDCRGPRSAGADRVLDEDPRQQRAEGDQRFGSQAVVERQPAARNTAAPVQTATRLSASRLPSRGSTQRLSSIQVARAASGGGQSHPHPGGADRRRGARARTDTSRRAPRRRRSSGSSWRRSRRRRRPARWSGCSRRPRRSRRRRARAAGCRRRRRRRARWPARRARTGARRPWTRRPDRRSSRASATIDAMVASTPRTISAVFRAVGEVMKRVSTSTRADRPGWAAAFRSVKTPAT